MKRENKKFHLLFHIVTGQIIRARPVEALYHCLCLEHFPFCSLRIADYFLHLPSSGRVVGFPIDGSFCPALESFFRFTLVWGDC